MDKVKLKSGTRGTHGGYSFLISGRLPEHRREVERCLTAARMGLIQDLGPTEDDLTTAQVILIDRVICKLGVIRCIEEHIRERSVMVKEEVAPALKASYLAYNNSIRLDLRELGIDKRQSEVKDLAEYINTKYGDEPDPKAPAGRAEASPKGQTRVKGTSAKAKGKGKGRGSL